MQANKQDCGNSTERSCYNCPVTTVKHVMYVCMSVCVSEAHTHAQSVFLKASLQLYEPVAWGSTFTAGILFEGTSWDSEGLKNPPQPLLLLQQTSSVSLSSSRPPASDLPVLLLWPVLSWKTLGRQLLPLCCCARHQHSGVPFTKLTTFTTTTAVTTPANTIITIHLWALLLLFPLRSL